jgi:hypothetical protein
MADVVPPDADLRDAQATAATDVFFVHPTSYFLGRTGMPRSTIPLANLVTDRGILTQQASVFNGTARDLRDRAIDRCRSQDRDRRIAPTTGRQRLDLAYHDVETAFALLPRPLERRQALLHRSHSQGTTHSQPC